MFNINSSTLVMIRTLRNVTFARATAARPPPARTPDQRRDQRCDRPTSAAVRPLDQRRDRPTSGATARPGGATTRPAQPSDLCVSHCPRPKAEGGILHVIITRT
uniref:Uncharacterized protein n=1 Tax=Heliothis virescens TaxID=7102 RepID=A0A2A4JQT2_HELVI